MQFMNSSLEKVAKNLSDNDCKCLRDVDEEFLTLPKDAVKQLTNTLKIMIQQNRRGS